MTEDDFNTHKMALAARRMEQPKKLSGQNQKYWTEIVSQQYNFDRGKWGDFDNFWDKNSLLDFWINSNIDTYIESI